jgi:hypothetical protein
VDGEVESKVLATEFGVDGDVVSGRPASGLEFVQAVRRRVAARQAARRAALRSVTVVTPQ